MSRGSRYSGMVMAAFAMILAGSGGSAEPASSAPQDPAPAGEGIIRGKVVFDGKVPKDRKISLEGDKYCSGARPEGLMSEFYKVGANGAVQNVFVYVKKGLEGAKFETPKEAVVLDQQGCRYEPHVFGLMAGQDLKIRNSDDTMHNVHALSQINAEINLGQARKGDETVKTFAQAEVMVKIKCDVHGWMSSYAGVLTHPYFKVTGEDGTFQFPAGLKPGDYVIEAWHEKFGTLTQAVKIGGVPAPELTFTFKGK